MTIINIDDNEAARYVRGRVLRQAGFRVFDGGTGAEALSAVETYAPDLVLLDVNLPDVHGIEVCRRIKSSPNSASVIVVQISASATAAPQAKEALENGADAYLTEPVDSEVLIATVKAMLRLRQAERLAAEQNVALREANERLEAVVQQLQESNDDLQHFANVASHDLQEPLRTVRSYAQLLSRSLAGKLDDEQKKFLSFIESGVLRMSTLLNALLSYTRIGRESPANLAVVPLGAALDWAMMNLHDRLKESGAVIHRAPMPVVWGDSVQLGQLMQNLISNAVKYRRADVQPEIDIRAEARGDDWLVSVRDNGVGIAEQYRERIFMPFKRLHGPEVPGSGIGLAISRRIVQAHGGRIWVESQPDNGSTFCFTLKAAAAAARD